MLVIFPFEEELYRRAHVPVDFVGHPLIDLVRPQTNPDAFLQEHRLDSRKPVIALLPGSRPNEVQRLLPVMSAAARIVTDRMADAQFVIARAPSLPDRLFSRVEWHGTTPVTVLARTDDVLAAADVAVTASGTATVQAALHHRPMVVVYKVSPLSYHLGRRFLKVDTFAMVNLIAGRRIVPELIQEHCTPQAIASEVLAYLNDPARAARVRSDLAEVRVKLGTPGASGRVADCILQVARAGAGGS
jgi:lipid-A-disaccharide synthase